MRARNCGKKVSENYFLENAKMGLTRAKMCGIMIGESGYGRAVAVSALN
jgi:hypothetical protein